MIDTPSRSDRVAAGFSQLIGGPVGELAARPAGGTRGRIVPAAVVLALTGLTLTLHWWQKSPCRSADTWVDSGQLSRFCYSDITALYFADGGLSQGGIPYLDYALEYPVVTGFFMTVIGVPVRRIAESLPVTDFALFYDANAVVLAAFALATAAMILSLRRARPWDAAMFAVAPGLLLSATVNWDLLAVVLAVAGLVAWARRHPVVAGVFLGLGMAAKLWPAFLLLPLVVLGLRTGRHRPAWAAVGAAFGSWLAVNLPVALADLLRNGSIDNYLRFQQLNTERAVDWGTLWYVGRYAEARLNLQGPFHWLAERVDPHLNVTTYLLFALACLGIAALALAAPRRPRVAALAFLTVAAFLLVNKVWSQQFVIWLIPLVVLARPRWGAFLAWQAAEVVYFFAFYGQLIRATPGRPEHLYVIPEGWFNLAAALRWGTVAVLCGYVVYDILRPDRDPVRRSYPDDPDGGPFDGAPDQLWLTVPGPGDRRPLRRSPPG